MNSIKIRFAVILVLALLAGGLLPATVRGNGASQDGNVWWAEVYHDTRAGLYRAPRGAVPTGQAVTIRLRTAANDLSNTTLVVYNAEGDTLWQVENSRESSDGVYDYYRFTIPDQATARILYYKFRLQDGADCDWYVDNHAHDSYDHEDRYENGSGMMVEGTSGFSTWALSGNIPTSVTLVSFTAKPQADAIQIEWETATELETLGFDLFRAEAEDGPRSRINPSFIPSQNPGSAAGALYEWWDDTVSTEATYYYWLEAVDIYGDSSLHGPVHTSLEMLRRLLPTRPRRVPQPSILFRH